MESNGKDYSALVVFSTARPRCDHCAGELGEWSIVLRFWDRVAGIERRREYCSDECRDAGGFGL